MAVDQFEQPRLPRLLGSFLVAQQHLVPARARLGNNKQVRLLLDEPPCLPRIAIAVLGERPGGITIKNSATRMEHDDLVIAQGALRVLTATPVPAVDHVGYLRAGRNLHDEVPVSGYPRRLKQMTAHHEGRIAAAQRDLLDSLRQPFD